MRLSVKIWNEKLDDMRKLWVHHEADDNSMNLCQLIPTQYEKHQMIFCWADEWVVDGGY